MNAQEEVQEFDIDAQVNWKHYYRLFKVCTKFSYRRRFRRGMKQLRREAALERALEAEKRKVERLRHVAHDAVTHVGMANYAEREEEAHDWIDAV